jgi:hypothetical protein
MKSTLTLIPLGVRVRREKEQKREEREKLQEKKNY